jgi:hypothetical protein
MNNITFHGGDKNSNDEMSIEDVNDNKINQKINITHEMNVLDKMISADCTKPNKLLNDFHANEMKNKFQMEPTPVMIAVIKGGKKNREIKYDNLQVLIDTGSSHSLINKKYGLESNRKESIKQYSTGSGVLKTKYKTMEQLMLPEFSDKKNITWHFSVFEGKEVGYDVIIGRDLTLELKMDISFANKSISWEGIEIPMRNFNKLKKWNISRMEMKAIIQESTEPIVTQEATERILKILDSKYEKANLRLVVKGAKHLMPIEREKLYKLLIKYQDIFDGSLGAWETDNVDFEMKEGAKPISQQYYPVPHLYKETFKKELDRLEQLGVLEKVQQSEWGSPTFIIPKKDGQVRFLTDFCRLNLMLKRKPYPLPRISDTLQQLEGFNYATSLDMNMGYYHIKLSLTAADMCTIITEYGKYRYKHLLMGVSCSPDIFQAKIYELLGDIEGTKAYIDDILVVKKGMFNKHLNQIDEIFCRCQKANLKLNPLKCRFGLNEIDCLGYIVAPTGKNQIQRKLKQSKPSSGQKPLLRFVD